MNLNPRFLSLIGIALFLYILTTLDFQKLLGLFSSFSYPYIALIFALDLAAILLGSFRSKYIFGRMELQVEQKDAITIWLKGQFLNLLIPGKLGELFRIKYVKEKTKSSYGRAAAGIILERVLDVGVLVILGALALYLLLVLFSLNFNPLSLLLIPLLLFFLIALFLNRRVIRLLLRLMFRLVTMGKVKRKVEYEFNEMYRSIQKMSAGAVLASLLLTLTYWFFSFNKFYVAALALHIEIPYWFVLLAAPASVLFTLIPVSISGIGTRDAALIFFFGLISLPRESAVALSLSFLMLAYLVYLIPGLVIYLFEKVQSTQ